MAAGDDVRSLSIYIYHSIGTDSIVVETKLWLLKLEDSYVCVLRFLTVVDSLLLQESEREKTIIILCAMMTIERSKQRRNWSFIERKQSADIISRTLADKPRAGGNYTRFVTQY